MSFISRCVALLLLLGCSDRASHEPADAGLVETLVDKNICPQIAFLDVAPFVVKVGSSARVRAEVVDPNDTQLTLTWEASSGWLSETDLTEVAYTCTDVGLHEISLAVEDDSECGERRRISVKCID